MFAYNPNLRNEKAVNINPSADIQNVNKSLSGVIDVLSEAQKQRNTEASALAKIKAAKIDNKNKAVAAKTKADTDIAIAKIKNLGKAKVSSADKNILIKEVNEDGGIDNMITKAIDSIEDDNLFFDFDLDETSIRDLKYSIQLMIMENPNEGMKYRLNRKEYVKEFMKEYGETDNSYRPFTNDKWVPNTDAMLIKKKMNDIKRLKGE